MNNQITTQHFKQYNKEQNDIVHAHKHAFGGKIFTCVFVLAVCNEREKSAITRRASVCIFLMLTSLTVLIWKYKNCASCFCLSLL